MRHTDLTQYDIVPEDMLNYLRYNGPHFNRKLCDFATSKMKKRDTNGKNVKIPVWTKDEVDEILKSAEVTLDNNSLLDYVYVANMCKADFYGSSVEDKPHVAKYIKDVIDDDDAYDGIVFNRFIADCAKKGITIDWDDMI